MNSYSYDPLPAASDDKIIRLINLLPGECSEPIACEIIHVSLTHIPRLKYEAVSYAWGDQAIKKPIQVVRRHSTGISREGSLWITTNLFDFLHQKRESLSKIETLPSSVNNFLWADAIAINQQDILERNHQVQLMCDIYAGAEMVIVWLGRDDNRTEMAMNLVPRLVRACNEQAAQNDTRNYYEMGAAGWIQYGLPFIWSSAYPAFASLLRRQWFGRVWMVQEVALSQTAHIECGVWRIRWDDFCTAVAYAGEHYLPVTGGNTGLLDPVMLIEGIRDTVKANDTFSLLGLLTTFRNFRSSDPRDKVYALCGLANDCSQDKLDIKPDYNLTVEQIYRKVAYSLLKKGHNLDILSVQKNAGSSEVKNLPSWAPDWSRSSLKSSLSLRTEIAPGEFWPDFQATSIDTPFEPQLGEKDHSIVLSGQILDRITHIGHDHTFLYRDETTLIRRIQGIMTEQHILNEWEDISQAQSLVPYAVTGETMLDAYWKTLVGGQFYGSADTTKAEHSVWDQFYRARFRCMPSSSYLRWTHPIMMPFLLIADAIYIMWNRPSYDMVMAFIQKMKISEERRMFRTETGFIGLASQNTQCDDSVFLCKGGRVPLVLHAKGDIWELAGDCYVHGIMNGEAFRASECKEIRIV